MTTTRPEVQTAKPDALREMFDRLTEEGFVAGMENIEGPLLIEQDNDTRILVVKVACDTRAQVERVCELAAQRRAEVLCGPYELVIS